jgi:hypothetical protein
VVLVEGDVKLFNQYGVDAGQSREAPAREEGDGPEVHRLADLPPPGRRPSPPTGSMASRSSSPTTGDHAGTVTACDNASMIRIDIRPVWRFRAGTERDFDFRLIALLAEIEVQGKLTHAAEAAAISYRMRGT